MVCNPLGGFQSTVIRDYGAYDLTTARQPVESPTLRGSAHWIHEISYRQSNEHDDDTPPAQPHAPEAGPSRAGLSQTQSSQSQSRSSNVRRGLRGGSTSTPSTRSRGRKRH
ncbi:hypothetical protein R3P38DRAFT_3204560 [Favolaschia claudopus]|uniref:Uncharacterized protein n=1 Tax=Favolaschia claudopus TaxID=2862362 RepID=A0AAV9ZYR3_9AGAR